MFSKERWTLNNSIINVPDISIANLLDECDRVLGRDISIVHREHFIHQTSIAKEFGKVYESAIWVPRRPVTDADVRAHFQGLQQDFKGNTAAFFVWLLKGGHPDHARAGYFASILDQDALLSARSYRGTLYQGSPAYHDTNDYEGGGRSVDLYIGCDGGSPREVTGDDEMNGCHYVYVAFREIAKAT